MQNKLNKLQNDFLSEFFERENRFFLTGGAALAGFYLGHRKTEDLDLFTLDDEIESGSAIARDVAQSLGAKLESIQTSPDFRRFLLTRDEEAIVVDLVREYVFQHESEKRTLGRIRIDSLVEIFANKLCALLSRSEIRDLIDVRELENEGLDLNDALGIAAKKDLGFSPAQLAWVLNQIEFGEDAKLPESYSLKELRAYLRSLIDRLNILAFPRRVCR